MYGNNLCCLGEYTANIAANNHGRGELRETVAVGLGGKRKEKWEKKRRDAYESRSKKAEDPNVVVTLRYYVLTMAEDSRCKKP